MLREEHLGSESLLLFYTRSNVKLKVKKRILRAQHNDLAHEPRFAITSLRRRENGYGLLSRQATLLADCKQRYETWVGS